MKNMAMPGKSSPYGSTTFVSMTPYPAMAVLVALFFVPLAFTLSQAFLKDGKLSFSVISAVFSKPYNLKVIGFTFRQAALSTLISLLIGLPGAWIMARFSFRGKKILRAICTVPFVLPPILVVLGFVMLYGNSGFLNKALMSLFGLSEPPLRILYSYKAIILAHSFYNFPIAMSLAGNSWEQLDENCEKAARTLGANQWRTFIRITLPRLMPSILSAALMIFLFCFTSFAVVLVLGGGPEFTTIEVEIYNQAKRAMDLGAAAALSIMSMAVCLIVLVADLLLQRIAPRQSRIGTFKAISKPSAPIRAAAAIYAILLVLFVISPLASVVARSFLSSATRAGAKTISFQWYAGMLSNSTARAVENSLLIGLTAGISSVALGLLLAVYLKRHPKSPLEMAAMLPMSISSVIIGLGYYITSRFLGRGSAFSLIVLAHVVITLPFCLRAIMPVYRAMPENLPKSALTLGCSPFRTFMSIELPLLRSALLTSFAFAFAISVGEMNATLMLSSNSIETIPVAIYRLINAYNYQGACALGTVLIIVCLAVFITTEAARKRSIHA